MASVAVAGVLSPQSLAHPSPPQWVETTRRAWASVRVCVDGGGWLSEKEICETARREGENKMGRGLPRWRWNLFSLLQPRPGSPRPSRLLSFRAARAHALMPAGWPCIVIIQSSCSHHVSSDQRRVYKVKGSCKIYAYMAVSVSGKINTAGLMRRNDWVLSDWH